MKTTRDITSSLECARRRRAVCRTHFIEDRIKREIEETYGEIQVPSQDIRQIRRIERERTRKKEAAKKSLTKVFQQREKARMIQDIIGGGNVTNQNQTLSPASGRRHLSTRPDRKVIFNEIELEY